jgi:hypothetical protein
MIVNDKLNLISIALSCSQILRPITLDLRMAPNLMQMQMQAWNIRVAHVVALFHFVLKFVNSGIFEV